MTSAGPWIRRQQCRRAARILSSAGQYRPPLIPARPPHAWRPNSRLFRGNDEVPAAILRPAGFRLFTAQGFFFALAHDTDARDDDAERHQIVANRRRAPFTQCEVVLVRPSRVG